MKGPTQGNASGFKIYENSVREISGQKVFLVNQGLDDFLIADKTLSFEGEEFSYQGESMIKAGLNHHNAEVLRRHFLWTAPVPVSQNARTFGLGDRLGNATAAHIQALSKYPNIIPVLAQQSKRELRLTGRTYSSVLDDVSFAVFRCGFKRGFGADGDHLKSEEEVKDALDSGYTMITLDCSEHIRNEIYAMSDAEVDEVYIADATQEDIYLGRDVNIGDDTELQFDAYAFKRMALIYNDAIGFAQTIYEKCIRNAIIKIDFEISIDETLYPTAPNQHYFVASELIRRGVKIASLAPRFCGEFQKGIEYIGDLAQFEEEFAVHALIADHFDYKVSVHSGSDKFSVYPAVKRFTKGRFHIKTAGTSWVVAMQSIASAAPALFREVYKYAESAYAEALQYYYVTSDFTKAADIDTLADQELPQLLENDTERQLIHICYGLILNLHDADGNNVFRDRLFKAWKENEALYFENIEKHIGRHLSLVA